MTGGPTTTFDYTWNSAWLATPADTEDRSLGAQRIRETKQGVGERLAVNHSLNGDEYDGMHTVVQVIAGTADPGAIVNGGVFYSKTVGGINEAFYQDNYGNVIQVTQDGGLFGGSVIPSGTNMLFLQATVPVGWTLNTSFSDRVIRLGTGSGSDVGGASGGSWNLSGMQVGGTALTVAQMPPHTHTISPGLISGSGFAGGSGAPYAAGVPNTGSTGGGAQHSHPFSNDATWRPAYVNAVVGTKD